MCGAHKGEDANIKILDKFKEKFIKYSKVKLPEYSKHLPCSRQLMEISETLQRNNQTGHLSESDIMDSGICQIQTIDVEGIKLNLFFDSGCGDMVAKRSVIEVNGNWRPKICLS